MRHDVPPRPMLLLLRRERGLVKKDDYVHWERGRSLMPWPIHFLTSGLPHIVFGFLWDKGKERLRDLALFLLAGLLLSFVLTHIHGTTLHAGLSWVQQNLEELVGSAISTLFIARWCWRAVSRKRKAWAEEELFDDED